jgi:cysteinyl-tRNA synthetase
MGIRIYNDLTRGLEEFTPLEPGKVRFYNCGPTVYDYFHIGNARSFIVMDMVRRYLQYRGYQVTFVQNFTDIDDRMIERAGLTKTPVAELAEQMIGFYFEDADRLGIKRADVHPRATELIPEQIAMIEAMVRQGYAYAVGGDLYYRVSRFAGYGKLSHKNLDDLVAGASERVDPDDRKEHPFDFALWKAQKPGEPAWESPWGPGRPGWHLECSAMARRYLGDTIDIHGGGEDLVFPHHENEIAQSEAVTGKPFARYWVHNAFLNIRGEKMSKSKGNFWFTRDVLARYDGEVVRLYLLSAHYRTQVDFSPERLDEAKTSLERLYNTRDFLLDVIGSGGPAHADRQAILDRFGQYRDRFTEAMDNDFNTAEGLAVIFELAREVNTVLRAQADPELARGALALLQELTGPLGLLTKQAAAESLDAEIQALVDARQEARRAKNWAEADRIRNELAARGIQLEDTPQGIRWKRVK